jgi:hypothetical protein
VKQTLFGALPFTTGSNGTHLLDSQNVVGIVVMMNEFYTDLASLQPASQLAAIDFETAFGCVGQNEYASDGVPKILITINHIENQTIEFNKQTTI